MLYIRSQNLFILKLFTYLFGANGTLLAEEFMF